MDPFFTNVQICETVAKKTHIPLPLPISSSADLPLGFVKQNQLSFKLSTVLFPPKHRLIGIAALGVPMLFSFATKCVKCFKRRQKRLGENVSENMDAIGSSDAVNIAQEMPLAPPTAFEIVLTEETQVESSQTITSSPEMTVMKPPPCAMSENNSADNASNSLQHAEEARMEPLQPEQGTRTDDISGSSPLKADTIFSAENDSGELIVKELSRKILMQIKSSKEPTNALTNMNDIKPIPDINSTGETLSSNLSEIQVMFGRGRGKTATLPSHPMNRKSVKKTSDRQLRHHANGGRPTSPEVSKGKHRKTRSNTNTQLSTDHFIEGLAPPGSSGAHHQSQDFPGDPPRNNNHRKMGKKKRFPRQRRKAGTGNGSIKLNGN